jgi:hypothetical protein
MAALAKVRMAAAGAKRTFGEAAMSEKSADTFEKVFWA